MAEAQLPEVNLFTQLMQYKHTLEKSQDPEEKKSIINALDKLPVKVCHLEATGIGRTINNIKKFDFDQNVVTAARELRVKWINMTLEFWTAEEEEEEETQ